MDLLSNLSLGFAAAISPVNLLYCLIGCILGTLVGVLPGLGPAATIAMLLPITFTLDPATSIIMLAGLYYGAQYGGSTSAILVNLPGEASSVVTAIDGYQMARQGRAGVALSTAAIGSFFAGTVATLIIAMFAPILTSVALKFGAAEYFSLMVLGLVASVALARGSLVKALAMMVLGLIVGLTGTDITSGTRRFAFGFTELSDGVNIVAVAMGMFGLAEVAANLDNRSADRTTFSSSISNMWPDRDDIRRIIGPIVRGTGIGALLGVLPGGGALLSSFVSYAVERKLSPRQKQFGKGAIEGVAGPESANNAGAQTSFIPLLTLGIPTNINMALIAGALMIQGVQPGPSVMTEQPALFWGLIASMWIGNAMLVLLNLPLVGIWVRLLTVPYKFLFPSILTFCCVGVFTLNNNTFDLYVMVAFGLAGYIFRTLECELAPFMLALVLGPMMEEYLRRALILGAGNPAIFVSRPISAVLLLFAVLAIAVVVIPSISRQREEAFRED